jgi:hypothetical protein
LITLRLEGMTRKHTLAIDDSAIRLNVAGVLTEEWVVPRDVVSCFGDAPPDVDPAVAPRVIAVLGRMMVRPNPNLALFFSKPQRIVPIKKHLQFPMPFSAEDSTSGVWVDGIALQVLKPKRAFEALHDSGLSIYGSLAEATAHAYGTIHQPLLSASHMQQPAVDTPKNPTLSEPGPFWYRPEPVARSVQHPPKGS